MKRRRFLIATGGTALALGAGALYWPNRWKYIVVHHSAGNYGTIEFLQRVHRERQGDDPIDAMPYHYVIGNGNGLGMGEIASDWRQELDIWGAHVSGKNSVQNFLGLGICLIGNFDETEVPNTQLDARVTLTRSLMSNYGLPAQNVSVHGMVQGESTRCPGKHFPFDAFKQAIA